MKRWYLGIATFIILLLGYVSIAHAASFHSGDNVTLSKSQIYDSVYAAGRTVDISNEIYGDVFCAGQTVNITGTVHGDVICAGQTVNITGTVTGDVRLAGQDVTLSANVSGNATIGAQTFTLASNGVIGGDLTTGGTDTTLNGTIGRDLLVGGTKIMLNGMVERNINAQTDTLSLTGQAHVGGNIDLRGPHQLTKDSGAVVSGKVMYTKQEHASKSKHAAVFGFGLAWFTYVFVAMLATALVLTLLFPRLFHTVTNRAVPRPWKALLTGFVASIAVPILALLLMITVIGMPLAFLVGIAWLCLVILSGPIFGYYLGRLILRGTRNPLLFMLVGAGMLVILYFIPIVGFIALLAAVWIGTGSLLLELYHQTPRANYKALPASRN